MKIRVIAFLRNFHNNWVFILRMDVGEYMPSGQEKKVGGEVEYLEEDEQDFDDQEDEDWAFVAERQANSKSQPLQDVVADRKEDEQLDQTQKDDWEFVAQQLATNSNPQPLQDVIADRKEDEPQQSKIVLATASKREEDKQSDKAQTITAEKKDDDQLPAETVAITLVHRSVSPVPDSPRETDALLGQTRNSTAQMLGGRMAAVPLRDVPQAAPPTIRTEKRESSSRWDSFCDYLNECLASTLFTQTINGDSVPFDATSKNSPSSLHKVI